MFLVLPSNSSVSVFPENRTSDFKVHLPKSVNLEGSWECGLVEIQYPRSWYTVSQLSKYWVTYRQGKVKATAHIPVGYYQDPSYVIDLLNHRLETSFKTAAKEAISDPTSGLTLPPRLLMNLQFNTKAHIATLEIQDNQPPNIKVKFSDDLAAMLGFDDIHYKQPGVHLGSRVVNLNSIDAIFVYSDIIESQIVGNALTSLQDVVAVQGSPGELVCSRFDKPHYKPVLRKHFSDIHISLRDDQSELIRFEKGKVIVTLHLRRAKLPL